MKNQFSLEINTPCHENFNTFLPTKDGGFCGSCKKEVIDFSKMNTKQVIQYFENYQGSDTCGQFSKSQLKTYVNKPIQNKKTGFWSGIALAGLSLFSFGISNAQVKDDTPNNTKNTTLQLLEKEFIVKGNVSENNIPLPGASVILKGSTIGTSTDFDGNFEFPKALKKGDILQISYVGFKSKKIVITNSHSVTKIDLKIDMKYDNCVLMGKVAVKKVYQSNRKK